jgi:ribonuclease-3
MPDSSSLAPLETQLGYQFTRQDLLTLALTHCSFPLQPGEEHNETLEFLGDAVLDMAVSDLLIRRFPEAREGELSKIRASLVNAQVLAQKAEALSLGPWLRLGWGEERSGGRQKGSILACAYEAVLGAVYLDGGFAPALALVTAHFAADLEEKPAIIHFDSKTQLQEVTQKIFKQTPVYEVVEVRGPDHQKRFVSQVLIAGKPYGRGEGPSKKSAHQVAASQTLELLKNKTDAPAETEASIKTEDVEQA